MANSSGLADRVRGVGQEILHYLNPLQGLFLSYKCDSPPLFAEAVAEIVHAIHYGSIDISDPIRRKQVVTQIEIAATIAREAAEDMKTFVYKDTPLSVDQIAVIHLFSQETDPDGPDSLYALTNAVLRNSNRNRIKAIRRYVFLFLTAVKNCPKVESRVVYRGVVGEFKKEYENNRIIVWYQASSCTTELDVLSNPMFLGTCGARTIFSIELAPDSRARRISDFSSIRTEAEVILPPNTRVKVLCYHYSATSSVSYNIPRAGDFAAGCRRGADNHPAPRIRATRPNHRLRRIIEGSISHDYTQADAFLYIRRCLHMSFRRLETPSTVSASRSWNQFLTSESSNMCESAESVPPCVGHPSSYEYTQCSGPTITRFCLSTNLMIIAHPILLGASDASRCGGAAARKSAGSSGPFAAALRGFNSQLNKT